MHKSKLFVFSLLCFIGGIFAGVNWDWRRQFIILWFCLCTAVISYILRRNAKAVFEKNIFAKYFYVCAIFVLGPLAAGIIRAQSAKIPTQYQEFYGKKALVYGMVADDPVTGLYKQTIQILPEGYTQKIQLSVSKKQQFSYGDYVYAFGKITQPKSTADFDYLNYLQAKDVYAQMNFPDVFILGSGYGIRPVIWLGLELKHWLYAQLKRRFAPEQGALLISLLVGDKSFLSAYSVSAFNLIGAAHMIAVSGYKLTLVLVSLEVLLPYIGRKKLFMLGLVFSVLYLVIADFAPAVWRAAVMSALFVSAKFWGRQYRIAPALVFTAALLLLFEPFAIKYDIGFILSFTGILGIVYIGPYLQRLFRRLPNALGIKEILISTTAAQLATFPVMIFFFQQFSPIAPLANLLLVPFLAPCIILGYICALPFFGVFAAAVCVYFLDYILIIAQGLVTFKFAYLHVHVSAAIFVFIYILEILAVILLRLFIS